MEQLFPDSIEQYLNSTLSAIQQDLDTQFNLDFEIQPRTPHKKFTPSLKIAQVRDAEILAHICKEVYEGSYPYREMEDPNYIRKMIQSPKHHFILFKTKQGEPAGCFRCALDFKHKKGYMGGFMIRKKFQGELDVVKAIMGSYMWMWTTYKDDILVWWCENRTAHTASQYITAVCGIHTVAFFPNKDIFYNRIESDVMGIIFVKKALRTMRTNKNPILIKSALRCFRYSNDLYNLGNFEIADPKYNLERSKIMKLKKRFFKEVIKDEYGYENVKFFIEGTNSSFTFIHTTHLKNFEKAKYHVSSLEELFIFLQELKESMKHFDIRYCELFVSAYRPEFQQMLYNEGFRARGYIPCWYYDKEKNEFEDAIAFNYYKGDLEPINLLPEGQKLVKMLNFNY
jgi:hypothetical protein